MCGEYLPKQHWGHHPRDDFTGVNPQYLDLCMCVLGTGKWILPGDKGGDKKTFRPRLLNVFLKSHNSWASWRKNWTVETHIHFKELVPRPLETVQRSWHKLGSRNSDPMALPSIVRTSIRKITPSGWGPEILNLPCLFPEPQFSLQELLACLLRYLTASAMKVQ